MNKLEHYTDYSFFPFFETNEHKDYTFEVDLHIPKLRLRVLQMPEDNNEAEAKCAIYVVVERIHTFYHREYLPKYIKYEASLENFYIKDLYSPHEHLSYVLQTIYPSKESAARDHGILMMYERYPKTNEKESFIIKMHSAAKMYVYLNLQFGRRVITMYNKFMESFNFYMNNEFSDL